jgi:hypothetical protein
VGGPGRQSLGLMNWVLRSLGPLAALSASEQHDESNLRFMSVEIEIVKFKPLLRSRRKPGLGSGQQSVNRSQYSTTLNMDQHLAFWIPANSGAMQYWNHVRRQPFLNAAIDHRPGCFLRPAADEIGSWSST